MLHSFADWTLPSLLLGLLFWISHVSWCLWSISLLQSMAISCLVMILRGTSSAIWRLVRSSLLFRWRCWRIENSKIGFLKYRDTACLLWSDIHSLTHSLLCFFLSFDPLSSIYNFLFLLTCPTYMLFRHLAGGSVPRAHPHIPNRLLPSHTHCRGLAARLTGELGRT